jgi:Secretion system C-terminal sorting domain
MKSVFCLLILHLFSFHIKAQIIYGANNYIEYHQGTLPIVISVPHGGALLPTNISNRTCNNPVTATDVNTIELAKQIDSACITLTGCKPHIIYCNLNRSKLDCNRNVVDGACGNLQAINAWNEFNHFIDTAQNIAQNQFNGKAFYIDLHGHGNPIQRLELGYLLYDTELALSDATLNTNQYINYSSIRNLVSTNVNGYSHAQLLRGSFALGTLLSQSGYPAVPSQQIPFPSTTSNYYSGGYNTANHTSYDTSNTVNGLQIECNFTNVRDSYLNRKKFADSLVSVLTKYLNIHLNVNMLNCLATSNHHIVPSKLLSLYPNPANEFIHIKVDKSMIGKTYRIYNSIGEIILLGKLTNENTNIAFPNLASGLYLFRLDATFQEAFKIGKE